MRPYNEDANSVRINVPFFVKLDIDKIEESLDLVMSVTNKIFSYFFLKMGDVFLKI
jgi:TFIIF-interacting CTD phosphatase-like protein